MSRRLLIFIAAAAAGWAISRGLRASGHTSAAELSQRGVPAEPAKPRAAKWSGDDALKCARERSKRVNTPGYNPYAEILESWTKEEILAALRESLKHPDCVLPGGSSPELPAFLLGALMKRDLDAALTWLTTLEAGFVKTRLIGSLASQWPSDKAAEGLEYLIAHRDFFPESSGTPLLAKALQESVAGGPEEVKAMIRKIQATGIEIRDSGEPLKMPGGFDFAALMDSPELEGVWQNGTGMRFLIEWSKQDREAAFDWMLAKHGAGELRLLMQAGDRIDDNIRWLGERTAQIEPAQREEFLASVESGWASSPMWARYFAEGIGDPMLQEQTCVRFGVQGMEKGNIPQALDLLELVEDPSSRLAALEQAKGRKAEPQDLAYLRKKLEEWQASPAQVEAIITRYQP